MAKSLDFAEVFQELVHGTFIAGKAREWGGGMKKEN